MGEETVELEVEIKHQTANAYLIDPGEDQPMWVPKSQVTEVEESGSGSLVTMKIKEWWAINKGLV